MAVVFTKSQICYTVLSQPYDILHKVSKKVSDVLTFLNLAMRIRVKEAYIDKMYSNESIKYSRFDF